MGERDRETENVFDIHVYITCHNILVPPHMISSVNTLLTGDSFPSESRADGKLASWDHCKGASVEVEYMTV